MELVQTIALPPFLSRSIATDDRSRVYLPAGFFCDRRDVVWKPPA
jgi:hypothetical protein